MNNYTLSEVFDTVYSEEFSEFDNPSKHFFSLRHRKAMKEILYRPTVSTLAVNRNIPLKKRVIIVLLVILLSALGITACAVISKSFAFKEHSEYTELYAVNNENSPIMINHLYYLPTVPDGYELYEYFNNSRNVFIQYVNNSTKRVFFFDQCIKEAFSVYFDYEHSSVEEAEINGKPALYLYNIQNNDGAIVWDNEDYIMEIGGHFSKDELIALAKSVEIKRE